MGFRCAIDTNLCSKPALSKCRGGFYNYRFFPHPNVTKPAPTIAYYLLPVLQIVNWKCIISTNLLSERDRELYKGQSSDEFSDECLPRNAFSKVQLTLYKINICAKLSSIYEKPKQ